MMRPLIFFLCTFAQLTLRAQSLEIISPDSARTFAYGGVLTHKIECNGSGEVMIARATFSNVWFAGDTERRVDEDFDFHFPAIHFDRARQIFITRVQRDRWISVAELRRDFPAPRYELTPHAKILFINRGGKVKALLSVTSEVRGGERWLETNENWSLQNLLAWGLSNLGGGN